MRVRRSMLWTLALLGSALLRLEAQAAPRAIDWEALAKETEQRRKGNNGVHRTKKAASATQLQTGGDFERALHTAMMMVQAMVNHAHDRIGGIVGLGDRLGELASLKRLINAVQLLGVTLGGEAQPPEDTLDEHAKRERGHDQDRIHDRAAFVDEFDDDIGDGHGEGVLTKSERKRESVAPAAVGSGEAPVSAHPVGGIGVEC